MTKVTFKKPSERGYEMRVQGHASFAEMGKDPVCAGASVLAMTIAECADALGRGGALEKAPTVTVVKAAGNVRVKAEATPEGAEMLRHLFLFAQVGFGLLSEAYPENVQVNMFEPEPVI